MVGFSKYNFLEWQAGDTLEGVGTQRRHQPSLIALGCGADTPSPDGYKEGVQGYSLLGLSSHCLTLAPDIFSPPTSPQFIDAMITPFGIVALLLHQC